MFGDQEYLGHRWVHHIRRRERLAVVLDLGTEDPRQPHQQVRRLGLASIGHVGGSLIHLLLVIAVVVLIINLLRGRRGL